MTRIVWIYIMIVCGGQPLVQFRISDVLVRLD